MDRDKLLTDICSGVRLRKTVTLDKSKPILQAEGEAPLKIQKFGDTPPKSPGILLAMNPPPAPPMPPSAPPLPPNLSYLQPGKSSSNRFANRPSNKSFDSSKLSGVPDRDAMLQQIRQGARLKPTKTIDKSKPMITTDSPATATARSNEVEDETTASKTNKLQRKPSLLMDELNQKLSRRPSKDHQIDQIGLSKTVHEPAPVLPVSPKKPAAPVFELPKLKAHREQDTPKKPDSLPLKPIASAPTILPLPETKPNFLSKTEPRKSENTRSVLFPNSETSRFEESKNISLPSREQLLFKDESSSAAKPSFSKFNQSKPVLLSSEPDRSTVAAAQPAQLSNRDFTRFDKPNLNVEIGVLLKSDEIQTCSVPRESGVLLQTIDRVSPKTSPTKETKPVFSTSPTGMSDVDTELTGSDETESGVGTADWGSSVSPTREASSPEMYEPVSMNPSRIIFQRGDSCWPPATAAKGNKTKEEPEVASKPTKIHDRIRQFQKSTDDKPEQDSNFRTYRRNPVKAANSTYKEPAGVILGNRPRRSGSVSDIASSLDSSKTGSSPLPFENRLPRRQGSIHDLVQQLERNSAQSEKSQGLKETGKFAARYVHTGDVRRNVETFQGHSIASSEAMSPCRIQNGSRSSRESFDAITKGFQSPNAKLELESSKKSLPSTHWMGTGRVEDRSRKFENAEATGGTLLRRKRESEVREAADLENIQSTPGRSPEGVLVSTSTPYYTESYTISPSARPPLQRNYSTNSDGLPLSEPRPRQQRLGSVLRQKPEASASVTQTWRHVTTTRDVLSRPGVAAVEQIIKNKASTIIESSDGRQMYNSEFLGNQNPADLPIFFKMVISDDLNSPTVSCRRRSENGY